MVDKKNHNNLDDEKELDELFEEVKSTKLLKAVKKAKRFSIMKIVFISLFTFIILISGFISISGKINNKRWNAHMDKLRNKYTVQAPNKFYGMSYTYKSFFGGKIDYKTFKYLNGIRINTGEHSTEYNLFGERNRMGEESFETQMNWEELNFLPRYNDIGQKLMVFYYPYVDYGDRYENDLSLLDDIGNNKYMEIAISFDKAYSIEEVNKMIPKSINLTWYWVDAVEETQKETQGYYINEQENGSLVEQYPDLCYENDAYGFKTINKHGERIENPEEKFINALKDGRIKQIYDTIAGEDKKLTKDDIKVQGIVVTGDAENLKLLKKIPFIKASSLGVTIDKY